MRRYVKKIEKREHERGQSIFMIAMVFFGLIAFVGLAIDAGLLFVGYGHLRRATDAAALAAATQFRNAYTPAQLDSAATEFLRLNGIDLDNASATVYTCDGGGSGVNADASLCTTPRRKLVRVVGSGEVKTAFLAILGINNIPITAEATGEAAPLDVVLVIDISETMTFDYDLVMGADNPYRDPSRCNSANNCHPFKEVKEAAKSLATFILNKPSTSEEDRISIVYFSNGWESIANRGTKIALSGDGWTNDQATALAAIDSLGIYDPGRKCTDAQLQKISNGEMPNPPDTAIMVQDPADGSWHLLPGLCAMYTDSSYSKFQWLACPLGSWNSRNSTTDGDFSTCTTTNLGGGLKLGAQQFTSSFRSESLPVEIILTDGMPNATCEDNSEGNPNCIRDPIDTVTVDLSTNPIAYCPHVERAPFDGTMWINSSEDYCIDDDATSYHSISSSNFDASDYARLAGLYAGCDPVNPEPACGSVSGVVSGPLKGQGAMMFTIGLSKRVATKVDSSGIPYGDAMLRYLANFTDFTYTGSTLDAASDPCSGIPYPDPANPINYHCGRYYFSKDGAGLNDIFTDIASRIFTRISK